MSENPITCERVEAEDLDSRYLAGTLDPATSEAFEAHFFGCDRCFELVQRGLELRVSLGPAPRPARRPARTWLALAAGIAAVGAGAMLWRATLLRRPAAEDTPRGGAPALAARAALRNDSLVVQWTRFPAAETYRLRFYTAQGDLLLERQVGETTLVLSRPPLPPAGDSRVFAQVLALDSLREPLARSGLVEVPAAGP